MSTSAPAQSSVFDPTALLERTRNVLFGDPNAAGEHEPTLLNQLLLLLIAVVVVLVVFKIIEVVVTKFVSSAKGTPWLVPKTKDAKQDLVIAQDPRIESSIPLRRSLNEEAGLEFSYVWWMFIEDFEYKKGSWKHVFHKGSPDSWPNRAPGVWLHPNTNRMRVYMNSYKKIANFVDIDNIPVGKWFHCGTVVTQNHLDVYVNGYLKSRLALEGIPKQNFGDVFINAYGGYNGYLSKMRYYDYAIPFHTLQADYEDGPDMELPYENRQVPPYLTPYWWANNYNDSQTA
jgi:hypothetical protein